jgi:hypothetical protein
MSTSLGVTVKLGREQYNLSLGRIFPLSSGTMEPRVNPLSRKSNVIITLSLFLFPILLPHHHQKDLAPWMWMLLEKASNL